MATERNYVPRLYVYAGRTMLDDAKNTGVVIYPLNDDGTLGERQVYGGKRFPHVVGGVYEGAEFDEKGSRGLDKTNRWVRLWHDQGDRMTWTAHDAEIERRLAAKRMEADAKKRNDFEHILLPIRELLMQHRQFGRWAEVDAIEAAVKRALRTPVRQFERKQTHGE